jgi:site-specific recombinase XerD
MLPAACRQGLSPGMRRIAAAQFKATSCGRCAACIGEGPSSPFVFVSERGSPFTTAGLARMIERAADGAGLELKAHPHMLRHVCSYALAKKGHDTRAIQGWLGHRSIISTAVCSALAPNRFKDFWRD